MYRLNVLPSKVNIYRIVVDLRIFGREPLSVETSPSVLSDESAPTSSTFATLILFDVCIELLALSVPCVRYN